MGTRFINNSRGITSKHINQYESQSSFTTATLISWLCLELVSHPVLKGWVSSV